MRKENGGSSSRNNKPYFPSRAVLHITVMTVTLEDKRVNKNKTTEIKRDKKSRSKNNI